MNIRILKPFTLSDNWKTEFWETTKLHLVISSEHQLPLLTDVEILTAEGKIFVLSKEETWKGFRVDDKLNAHSGEFNSREFMDLAMDFTWSEYADSMPEICAITLKEAIALIKLYSIGYPKQWSVWNMN